MKKRSKKQKMNMRTSHSNIVKRIMLESLLNYGKLETTQKRARVLKSYVDEKISYALNSKSSKVDNALVSRVGSVRLAEKLFSFASFLRKQGSSLSSGFTKLVKTRYRKGDNSLMVEVALMGFEDYKKDIKPVKKASKKTKTEKKSVKKVEKQKSVKKVSQKVKEKAPEIKEIEREKKESFFTKLSERFLGRKSKGPVIERKGRAQSRSGI